MIYFFFQILRVVCIQQKCVVDKKNVFFDVRPSHQHQKQHDASKNFIGEDEEHDG